MFQYKITSVLLPYSYVLVKYINDQSLFFKNFWLLVKTTDTGVWGVSLQLNGISLAVQYSQYS